MSKSVTEQGNLLLQQITGKAEECGRWIPKIKLRRYEESIFDMVVFQSWKANG